MRLQAAGSAGVRKYCPLAPSLVGPAACHPGSGSAGRNHISAQHLVVLADDRAFHPAENITPVVRRDVVARYGARMPTLINAVSARLTTGSLRSLNAQAVLDGRRPRSAAEAWLRAQGLM
jgi:hypothetical protein